jgi:hypothetical protein
LRAKSTVGNFAERSTSSLQKRSAIPGYAPALAAYHRAFAEELQSMIAELPIGAGDRVLDVACGDGSYSGWLAEHVGPSG